MKMQQNYEKDFYAWALESAQLIREGKFLEIDRENIAEELESMGRRDKRELMNRLAVLLAHLLKWRFQSERQGNSWKHTIEEQRFELIELLNESPSLKHELDSRLEHAYQKAVLMTVKETGMAKKFFPEKSPFSLEETLHNDFFPENSM